MARTTITANGTSHAGTVLAAAQAADVTFGNSLTNPDGQTVLLVTNAGLTTRTLLVRVAATVDGLPVTPRTVTIPAGTTKCLGRYEPAIYGTTLQLDADSTDLTFTAMRCGDQAAAGSPFTLAGQVVIADLTFLGVSTSGQVLTVDTALTTSTLDGNVLVVTV